MAWQAKTREAQDLIDDIFASYISINQLTPSVINTLHAIRHDLWLLSETKDPCYAKSALSILERMPRQ